MNLILEQLVTFFGPFGSPYWWILGGLAASVFLATWARSIRTLLPFIGAGTVIVLILWALVNAGLLTVNWPL
jgi:hypothetical protein